LILAIAHEVKDDVDYFDCGGMINIKFGELFHDLAYDYD
jgi:hypothetical protein